LKKQEKSHLHHCFPQLNARLSTVKNPDAYHPAAELTRHQSSGYAYLQHIPASSHLLATDHEGVPIEI